MLDAALHRFVALCASYHGMSIFSMSLFECFPFEELSLIHNGRTVPAKSATVRACVQPPSRLGALYVSFGADVRVNY